jgi:UDP-4-amino-4,6-dideoxy-N-acetyl-beta-L-altrosamine N-acetyltransferase
MIDINLRKITSQDIEMVRRWRNSAEVSSYMYNEDQITEDQQKKWFDKISNDSTSVYWIIEYNDKAIGLASITGINNTLSSCYWAFYLGDTSIRGGGIGAKVEFNVLEYVFNQLNLNKLRCEVFVSNDKVIKMHEKFGFRREAFYREHCIKSNVKLDVVGLAILKSEWDIIREFMRKKVYGE